jgi:hypothetical protein
MKFVPQMLPAETRSLAAGVPQEPAAPPGSLFVLGAHGGYMVPPRRFTLLFGRDDKNVHVLVGSKDQHVSRCHGQLECDGTEWWMRNRGVLPIRMPGESLLLSGQEMPLSSGYLPLFIGAAPHRDHLLEVRVVGGPESADQAGPDSDTVVPDTYELSDVERLVLTALAQRYLRYEKHPQPLSWNEVAKELNQAPDGRRWTPHRAANVVTEVRRRLAAEHRVEGVMRAEGAAEPIGITINHTLIVELLRSTTLLPTHLRLLGGADD